MSWSEVDGRGGPIAAPGEGIGGPPLRLGYVVKRYPRLSETFVLDEILGLEEAGAAVQVFSLRQPDDGRYHADLARVRGEVRYVPGFGSGSAMEAIRTVAGLGRTAGEALDRAVRFLDRLPSSRRASVFVQALHVAEQARRSALHHLHAHFMTVAAHTAYLAHVFTGIPFTVTAHAKDVYRETVDPVVFEEVARAAVAVVTVCEANRRHILDRLLPGGGVRVERVYNGIPLEAFAPNRGSGGDGRRESGLVLAVGRLVEKKGYHVLLQACRLLVDRGVPFRCVVVGDGPETARLLADRERLGVGEHVELVGAAARHDVLSWMRRATVLAAPCVRGSDGNQDALPTVLLEALALGLPAVSTPVGGIPEIVGHGEEGLLVPEGDTRALAAALHRLLEGGPEWERLSLAGPPKAASRFDRRRSVGRLLEIFGGGPRPRGRPASGAAGPRAAVAASRRGGPA